MTNPRLLGLGAFILLLPVSVEIPAESDSGRAGAETRISVIGAVGHYALIDRGCEGQVISTHPRDFREAGGEFQQRFANGVAVGARAGAVSERSETRFTVIDYSVYPYRESLVVVKNEHTNLYVNPSLGVEGTSFGMGFGWILAREDFNGAGGGPSEPGPSFHLRLGRLERLYLRMSSMESVPLYSGGGYTEVGLGLHPHRLWDLYMGYGGGPYDGPGLVLKLDRRVNDHHAISSRARLGNSGGESQAGFGLGWTYVSSMPVDPPPASRNRPGGSSWGLAPRRPPEGRIPVVPRRVRESWPEYGTYQHVDSLPRVLSRTAPVLPDSVLATGVAGTVTVAVLIDQDGNVRDQRVVHSIPALDQAAIECVRQWLFRPALLDGRAVPCWLAVPVEFESQ